MLEHATDVNAVCKNEFTPLHLAAKLKTPGIAESLLKAKADVMSLSRNGYAPLHFATLDGHIDTVKQLVEEYSAPVSLPGGVR